MGAFTQRQATYTPPFDGMDPRPTLVGASPDTSVSDRGANDNGMMPPARAGDLPQRDDSGEWRIELRRLPLAHRGHAVLALVAPTGKSVELNGLAQSRNTGEVVDMGIDGGKLIASSKARTFGQERTEMVGEVARGSYDQIVKNLWARGLRAADAITDRNYDYKAHDPAYELGGSGGQIQNSNSVAYTLGRVMGIDLDGALRQAGRERTFPGWGRDLLDPHYQSRRYAVPPVFPHAWTP